MSLESFSGRPLEHPPWDALFVEAAGGDVELARLAASLSGADSIRSNLSTAINSCNAILEHGGRVQGEPLEHMETQLLSMIRSATALKAAAAAVEKAAKRVAAQTRQK